MAHVQISNLKKSYGSVIALQDISIDIPTGSFFTLLGPSGCGKTTLLRTIAGFHQQDQGSIAVDNQILDGTPVHLRDIGMVFQDYAIFPHMSVYKNIAFGLRQRKVPRQDIDGRVSEMLQIVQLDHLSGRMPHELSGGQQQRVGLARALVTNPKVLLMDEPLSNLDAQLRIDLRRELRSIQQRLGITTIYVTHDQEEALEMSDFVCVMHKGIIQQSDTPWSIYHQPANRFVASFVGSNNFLPFAIHQGKPAICNTHFVAPEAWQHLNFSSNTVASIRPENIQLRLLEESHHSTDHFVELEATVQYQSFAGRELRLTAQTTDGSMIQVITEPKPGYVELVPGSLVCLNLPVAALSFFHTSDSEQRVQ